MEMQEDKETKAGRVYGIRPLIEALKTGLVPDKVFVKNGLRGEQVPELMGLMKKLGVAYSPVPEEKLNRLTRDNHQGVFAFISPIDFHDLETVIADVFESGVPPLVLVLDHITDVRNFGAIVRTAECIGVDAVVIPGIGSAPVSEDAIKTSAGALFRVPICKAANLTDAVLTMKSMGLKVVAASEKTDKLVYDGDFTSPLAVVMGNEERGISPQLLKACDARAKLPMAGGIGSLNVSVACGAFVYEVFRQRLKIKK